MGWGDARAGRGRVRSQGRRKRVQKQRKRQARAEMKWGRHASSRRPASQGAREAGTDAHARMRRQMKSTAPCSQRRGRACHASARRGDACVALVYADTCRATAPSPCLCKTAEEQGTRGGVRIVKRRGRTRHATGTEVSSTDASASNQGVLKAQRWHEGTPA